MMELSQNDAEASSALGLTNWERLRTHVTPDGLAIALMDAWAKGDPDAPTRMLAVLHQFHKPK